MSAEKHQFPIDPFHSDTRAFEILAERGLNDTGIQLIKDQIAEFSEGYRHPERKLTDVLEGGALVLSEDILLLLHGNGGIERGAGSGDCSESSRTLVSRWGESSQHRYLGKAGLHPFYLEVAAPRLFTDVWHTGTRVRAGHTVVALGSPEEYLSKGSDDSFIIIDPTLGTAAPMNSASYHQTGARIVPEHDKHPLVVPVAVFDPESGQIPTAGAVPSLVLGIDETASFVYSLSFKHTPGVGPVPQINASDERGEPVAKFEADTQRISENEKNAAKVPLAEPTLMALGNLLLEQELEIHNDFDEKSVDALIVGGHRFRLMSNIRYPWNPQQGPYLQGMKHALEQIEATSQNFSLKF